MSKITKLKALVSTSRLTKLKARTRKWATDVKSSISNSRVTTYLKGRNWKKIGAGALATGIGYGVYSALNPEDKQNRSYMARGGEMSYDDVQRMHVESDAEIRAAIGLIRKGCDRYLSNAGGMSGIPDSLLDDKRKQGLLEVIFGLSQIERNETRDVSDFIEKARIAVPSVSESGFMFEGVLDNRVGVNTIEEIVDDSDCAGRRLDELQFTLSQLGTVSSLKPL